MSTVVEEALEVWREGERLLEGLPTLSADREVVLLAVARMRELYHALTARGDEAHGALEGSRETIADARAVLRAMRERPQAVTP